MSMRLLFSVLLLVLFSCPAAAQKAAQYIDVVFPFEGGPLEGTIVSYEYGKRVVLVLENGDVKELAWDKVKRVNFRFDRSYKPEVDEGGETTEEVVEEAFVLPTPDRKFRHQVTSSLTFGKVSGSNDFFNFTRTTIGGGLAYHLLRDVSFLTVGAGLDLNLMNHSRGENVLAATVMAEVPIGKGRWRPFFRMETGPTFPFGAGQSGEEVTSRAVTLLYHPALGVEITPRNGGWGKMTLDVGYRFLNSRFDLITTNLDVVERVVNYRRLSLRGGMRF